MPTNLVLVVDDDPLIRRMLARWLAVSVLGPPWSVRAAADGAAALAIVADQVPALVVTDLSMPGMDGLELCRRLKADAATRAVPLIAISGEPLEAEAFAAGCDAFLPKPPRLDEWAALIRAFLPPADTT